MLLIKNGIEYTLDTCVMPEVSVTSRHYVNKDGIQCTAECLNIPVIRRSGKPDWIPVYSYWDSPPIDFDGDHYEFATDDNKEFERFKRNLLTWYELNCLEGN